MAHHLDASPGLTRPLAASRRAIFRRRRGLGRRTVARWRGAPLNTRPGNPIGVARGQVHRYTTTKGVPEHDDPRLHLVEHSGHGLGVLPESPH